MTINMVFDPIKLVIDIVEENWDVDCDIYFGELQDKEGVAWTVFDDEDSELPLIFISPDGSYKDIVESIAHELSHVVMGKTHVGDDGEGHSDEWMAVFRKIFEIYNEKTKEIFKDFDGEFVVEEANSIKKGE